MRTASQKTLDRRLAGENLWLFQPDAPPFSSPERLPYKYSVLESEDAVGQAMLGELLSFADEKANDIVIVLLGGRGAQAMYRLINQLAATDAIDSLLGRLHV